MMSTKLIVHILHLQFYTRRLLRKYKGPPRWELCRVRWPFRTSAPQKRASACSRSPRSICWWEVVSIMNMEWKIGRNHRWTLILGNWQLRIVADRRPWSWQSNGKQQPKHHRKSDPVLKISHCSHDYIFLLFECHCAGAPVHFSSQGCFNNLLRSR